MGKDFSQNKNGAMITNFEQINNFASKWIEKFSDKRINYLELIECEFGDECVAVGFKMDCGCAFTEKYGEAISNYNELYKMIEDVTDVYLLGSAIFSKWRYFNHWAYSGAEILEPQNRNWFLIALDRLRVLSSRRMKMDNIINPVYKELNISEQQIANGKVLDAQKHLDSLKQKYGLIERPYIICHMTTSIDGKVTGKFLETEEVAPAIEVYYEINRAYQADAFACGRVTMEGSFTQGFEPDLSVFDNVQIPREDYIADLTATYFAIAFDRFGRLGWQASRISDEDPGYDNAHVIEVVLEDVSDAYLAYLQSIKVSYVFAGKGKMNLPLALEKLLKLFGIKKLLLEGGSIINGAFAEADVIDELSLVVAPVIGVSSDKPLFEPAKLSAYTLQEVEQYKDSVLWLNYKR